MACFQHSACAQTCCMHGSRSESYQVVFLLVLLLSMQTPVITEAADVKKVAINGFGRIGRNFLRCWNGREKTLLDVVAINDSGGVKQVLPAHCFSSIVSLRRPVTVNKPWPALPACQSLCKHTMWRLPMYVTV